MKWLLSLSLALVVGIGKGGMGGEACTAQNGDVNADGRVELTDAVTLLSYLFLGDPQQLPSHCEVSRSMGLPDTGQEECSYRADNFPEWVWYTAPCREEGECAGQDAQYATGCSMDGPDGSGRFLDNGDGTVNDTCTGLMWQQETMDADGDGEVTLGDRSDWCQALDSCDQLSLAGHSDWRLPNVRELQSLVHYGNFEPALDEVFGLLPYWYWSSTTTSEDPARAWYVDFQEGFVFRDEKSFSLLVRAVRGGS